MVDIGTDGEGVGSIGLDVGGIGVVAMVESSIGLVSVTTLGDVIMVGRSTELVSKTGLENTGV